jgi:hypothetical protein
MQQRHVFITTALGNKQGFLADFAIDIIMGRIQELNLHNATIVVLGTINKRIAKQVNKSLSNVACISKNDLIQSQSGADKFIDAILNTFDVHHIVGHLWQRILRTDPKFALTIPMQWTTATYVMHESAARIYYTIQNIARQSKQFYQYATDLHIDLPIWNNKLVYMANLLNCNTSNMLQCAYLDKQKHKITQLEQPHKNYALAFGIRIELDGHSGKTMPIRTKLAQEYIDNQEYFDALNNYIIIQDTTNKVWLHYNKYLDIQRQSNATLIAESVLGRAIPMKRFYDALYTDCLPIFMSDYDNIAKQTTIDFANLLRDNELIISTLKDACKLSTSYNDALLTKLKQFVKIHKLNK